MKQSHFLLAVAAGLFALTAACSAQQAPPPASSVQTKPAMAAPHAALWGELKPVVSVKELMRDMLYPASDFIFAPVPTVSPHKGVVQPFPPTTPNCQAA